MKTIIIKSILVLLWFFICSSCNKNESSLKRNIKVVYDYFEISDNSNEIVANIKNPYDKRGENHNRLVESLINHSIDDVFDIYISLNNNRGIKAYYSSKYDLVGDFKNLVFQHSKGDFLIEKEVLSKNTELVLNLMEKAHQESNLNKRLKNFKKIESLVLATKLLVPEEKEVILSTLSVGRYSTQLWNEDFSNFEPGVNPIISYIDLMAYYDAVSVIYQGGPNIDEAADAAEFVGAVHSAIAANFLSAMSIESENSLNDIIITGNAKVCRNEQQGHRGWGATCRKFTSIAGCVSVNAWAEIQTDIQSITCADLTSGGSEGEIIYDLYNHSVKELYRKVANY